MKVRITFYGMTMLEVDKENGLARVMAPRAMTTIQTYHHPILCFKDGDLAFDPAWPRIESLEGLLDQTPLPLTAKDRGVYLSGATLRIGSGRCPTHSRRKDVSQLSPVKDSGGWSHVDWLAPLRRIHPQASLKPGTRTVDGDTILSVIELRGGELKVLEPMDRKLRDIVWWFSPNCQQVVSDCFMWQGQVDGFDIETVSGARTRITPGKSGRTVDLFLSHEAPRFEREIELERIIRQRGGEQTVAAEPRLEHFQGFYAHLNGPLYEGVGTPRGIWRINKKMQHYQECIGCVPTEF